MVNYLIEHGIAKDRLSPVGYGKEKPKTIRKKLTEKYPWLKEGDVLTEEFIKKLDKDKQEICNQLNRRTEFIVLRITYGMFDENGNLKNPPKAKEQDTEALKYHVDGVRLVGYAPVKLLGEDPYLSRLKLLAPGWDGVEPGRKNIWLNIMTGS